MNLSFHRCQRPEIKLARTVLQFPLNSDNPKLTAWLALSSDTQTQKIVGAVALEGDQGGGLVSVRVLPPFCRQKIGTKLLNIALEEALKREIPELITLPEVTEEAGQKFAISQGFKMTQEMESFEVNINKVCDYFQEFYDWFVKRGSIPSNLQQRWNEQVVWGASKRLLDAHFGYGVKRQVNRIIAQGMQPNDWAFTLTLSEDLVGIGVGYLEENRVIGNAYSIAPAYRNGWAHIVGKYLCFTSLRERYPDRPIFCFSAGDSFSDTWKWSKKMEATCVGRFQIYTKLIL